CPGSSAAAWRGYCRSRSPSPAAMRPEQRLSTPRFPPPRADSRKISPAGYIARSAPSRPSTLRPSSPSLPQGQQPRPTRPRSTGSTRASSCGSRLGVDELDRLGPPGGQYPGGQLLYQLRPIAKPFHRALAALADALAVEGEVASGFLHHAQLC